MQRTATVSIWDVMDQVWVTAQVRTYSDVGHPQDAETTQVSVTVQGTGESNDERWLLDALIALAEKL